METLLFLYGCIAVCCFLLGVSVLRFTQSVDFQNLSRAAVFSAIWPVTFLILGLVHLDSLHSAGRGNK